MGVEARASGTAVLGLRDVAARMLAVLPEVVDEVVSDIAREVPAFAEDVRPDLASIARKTSEANIAQLLDGMLRDDIVREEPTTEVLERTREIVRSGAALADVLRAYRIGHATLGRILSRHVRDLATDPAGALRLLEDASAHLFEWIDMVCDGVTREYEAEAARLSNERSFARLELVRRIAAGEPMSPGTAGRRLGYDLLGSHVAAIAWLADPDAEDDPGARLEIQARALTDAAGRGRGLVVPSGTGAVFVWVHAETADALEAVGVGPGVGVAVGEPGEGLAGFRRSHLQAAAARDVLLLGGRVPPRAVGYRGVEVTSLCSADLERAGDFVRAELGPLAGDDDQARRLRATLRTHFEEGTNYRSTARRLGLHHNTVIHRIRRAEEILGRPLLEGRLRLELALHLAETLGDALRPGHP